MGTDFDRFRIAVALTALKFKPPEQSFLAYTLELRSHFPTTESAQLVSVDSWRSLALKLERDLEALKEKYEAELIKTSALESGVMPVSSWPAPNSSLEQPVASKKKPKKKSGPATTSCSENAMGRELPIARPDLRAILEDTSTRKEGNIPWISHQSLFSALDNFMQLTALPDARLDLVSSVTLRTVSAIAKQINNVILPPDLSGPSESNTLNRLGITLHHVLTMSLPLLEKGLSQTAEPIIALLDRTIRSILVPIVHAFHVRSKAYLGSLFLPRPDGTADKNSERVSANSHRSLHTDTRVDMLDLFRKIFCFLDGRLRTFTTSTDPSLVSYTFRATLILETIRELDDVLAAIPTAGTSDRSNGGVDIKGKRDQRIDRVKRLAKKDTLWYLCTILHILFCELSIATPSQPVTAPILSQNSGEKNLQKETDGKTQELADNLQGARLLSEGISDGLFQLVTRCKRRTSSPYQPQKSGIGNEAQHVGTNFGQGGLQCAVERSRTAVESRGRADVNISGGEGCARMLRENSDTSVEDDADVSVSAAGQHRKLNDNGGDQSVGSGAKLRDQLGGGHGIELDEVGYEMLLGVLERYWIWSRSWEL